MRSGLAMIKLTKEHHDAQQQRAKVTGKLKIVGSKQKRNCR